MADPKTETPVVATPEVAPIAEPVAAAVVTPKPAAIVIAAAAVKEPEPVVVEGQFVSAKGDEFLKGYIQQYLDIMKLGNIARSIAAFSAVIRYTLKNPTDDNMACLLVLFKKYKDTILAENIALQGAPTLPASERNKVEIMYCVFREMSTDKRKLNMDRVRSILGDKVVTWCAKQK